MLCFPRQMLQREVLSEIHGEPYLAFGARELRPDLMRRYRPLFRFAEACDVAHCLASQARHFANPSGRRAVAVLHNAVAVEYPNGRTSSSSWCIARRSNSDAVARFGIQHRGGCER